jgi:hypothetical protein
MGIGMAWGALGYGQAWSEFPSVDACEKALCQSARRVYARVGPSPRGALMKRSASALRSQMRTDGLHALVHGREWHGEQGGVWVTLYPRTNHRARARHLR